MNFKRLTAALLSTCLILSAVACSKKDKDSSPEKTPEAISSNLNKPGTFPISKEKVKFTIGVQQDPNLKDWKTNALTKELEEKANVDFEFVIFPSADTAAKLSAMIASQTELPELFAFTTVGLDSYYDTGVLLPLTKYYKDPNMAYYFNKRLEKNPEQKAFLLENSKCPDNENYATIRFSPEIGNEYPNRMWINQTWLTKLGLPMPKTTDEYYNTLKAFVTKDPNGNGKADEIGLMGSKNGWNQKPQDTLMNAFTYVDTRYNYLTAKDGKLDVPYNKAEWKAGLEYLNKLVKEGLMSPLTFTQDSNQFKTIAENPDAQVLGSMAAGSLSFYTAESKRKADFVPMPPLTGPKGANYATYVPTMPGYATFITKYCKNPELAFRMFDYMYEEKMSMWQRFGVPGVDWDTKVDGIKGLYEDSLGVKCGFRQINNVMTAQNSLWGNTLPNYRELLSPMSIQGVAMPDNKLDYSKFTADAVPLYMKKHPSEIIYRIPYTTDEFSEIKDITAAINTFRNESTARFITGDKPMSDWDSYVKELDKIGLSKYVQISQKAYDRTKSKK